MKHFSTRKSLGALVLGLGTAALLGPAAMADQVILDDLIVDGSACIGFDCVNGESFGFDTLRLKENNLRIKGEDTSSTASFPGNDWQITFNDSANGGANKFSIDDLDGGKTPFTIEANAPTNSLYVDDGGRIGIGTATPVVLLHVKSGNTPTLRLEQDGSSGFTPLVWDLGGNEANFFIRDATNGSTLPFRIFPGAPSNALNIEATTGDVGIGDTSPDAALDVERSDGTAQILVEETSVSVAPRTLLALRNNGSANFELEDTSVTEGDNTGRVWKIKNDAGALLFTTAPGGAGELEMSLTADGHVEISGNFISVGTTLAVPDYVFGAEYELRPLSEVRSFINANRHLPEVPSASEITEKGLDMTTMQMTLLLKIEELTLYALQQNDMIEAQYSVIEEMKTRLVALEN